MNTKTILAALALTLAPTFASALCIHGERAAQTTSCQAGSTWDAEAGKCVTDPLG